MKPNIDWHQLYDLGFNLIPVRVGEKIPAIQWAPYQNRLATLNEIAEWQRAGHNAGIVTGAISKLVVLDCDTPEAIAQAKDLGIPAGTVAVATAKGCHFYFRYPGFHVANKTRLRPGMDVRGDGGFVVAPGSVHPSGTIYAWIGHPAWDEIGLPPEWLLESLSRGPEFAVQPHVPIAAVQSPYGLQALESELTFLRNAPAGTRNHQLNRSAYALAQLSAGGHVDACEAQTALNGAALVAGLELHEISRTIESGWQAGLRGPRGPKESDAATHRHPTIISARAISKMHFPPLQWAIPDLLPEGLTLLAGKPKFGKSYFSLQMAVAVAAGEAGALGSKKIEAGDVLVCALEDSTRRLKDRLARIYPFGGAPARLDFATSWPRLDQRGIEELDAWCDRHPDARLIILDTWRAIKPTGNGRSSAYDEDATAAAPLLEFVKRRPGLAVVVIHHVRKMDADDVFDTISGTHGLTGIFDTLMVLARHGEGAKLSAQGRDLDGYEKSLERDRRTGGWTVKGDAVALAKTGERQELLDILAKANLPMTLAQLASAVGKKSDTTRHLLKSLVAEGTIYQPYHGSYAVTPYQLVQNPQSEEEAPY